MNSTGIIVLVNAIAKSCREVVLHVWREIVHARRDTDLLRLEATNMDITKLVDVLRATLQPDQREAAEKQLSEVHKIIGFVPALLQLVMSEQIDMPVRQAGVVYMKIWYFTQYLIKIKMVHCVFQTLDNSATILPKKKTT